MNILKKGLLDLEILKKKISPDNFQVFIGLKLIYRYKTERISPKDLEIIEIGQSYLRYSVIMVRYGI